MITFPSLPSNSNVILGNLRADGKDINNQTIKQFKKIIAQGKTIVWAGPMGVYEEEESRKGSWEIAKTVANINAFKVAGGGDTHRILSKLNLWDKFDFVSVGGGAMLSFLQDGSLVGMK